MWPLFNKGPSTFCLFTLNVAPVTLIFKEKFPSVINLILRYLATIWNQNKLCVGFRKQLPITMNPRGHVILFLHHGTLIGAYPPTKENNFPRKQEGQMIEGNMTPVFTGSILFWMALLFWLAWLIVIIVLGSVPLPSNAETLDDVKLRLMHWTFTDLGIIYPYHHLPLSISKGKGPHTFLFLVLSPQGVKHLQSNLDLPSHNFIKSLPTTEIICCIRFGLISFIPIPETVCGS